MKLSRIKPLVALALVGVVLLTIIQWWSYRQVGEILEDYTIASTNTGYVVEKHPVLPHLYVNSLRGRIIGYRYDPGTQRYLVVVEGRLTGSRESAEYQTLLTFVREWYYRELERTEVPLVFWWGTDNESYLHSSAVRFMGALRWKAELTKLERSGNRTLVIVSPPYPYALALMDSFLYIGVPLLLVFIAGYLLRSAPEVVAFVSREKTWLGLFLIVLLGLMVLAGIQGSREDPLLNLGPMWWTSDGDCTHATYAVVRNERVDDILVDAIKAAKDKDVYGNRRARSVILLLPRDDAQSLVERLKDVTTVKAVSFQYPSSNWEHTRRKVFFPTYLDFRILYGNVLPSEAFDALLNVSRELVKIENVVYPNCGDMVVIEMILEE